jgi:hypothetical protein
MDSYNPTARAAHRVGVTLKLEGYRDFGKLWESLTPQGRNLLTDIKEGRVRVRGLKR